MSLQLLLIPIVLYMHLQLPDEASPLIIESLPWENIHDLSESELLEHLNWVPGHELLESEAKILRNSYGIEPVEPYSIGPMQEISIKLARHRNLFILINVILIFNCINSYYISLENQRYLMELELMSSD